MCSLALGDSGAKNYFRSTISLRLRGIPVVFTIESKQGDLCGVAPGVSMYSINLDQKDELKNV